MKFLKTILVITLFLSTAVFAEDNLISENAAAIMVDSTSGEIVELDVFAK